MPVHKDEAEHEAMLVLVIIDALHVRNAEKNSPSDLIHMRCSHCLYVGLNCESSGTFGGNALLVSQRSTQRVKEGQPSDKAMNL